MCRTAAEVGSCADPVYIASRKFDELQRAADQLNQVAPKEGPWEAGTACIPVQADLSSKAGCDALADNVKQRERTSRTESNKLTAKLLKVSTQTVPLLFHLDEIFA